MPGITLRYPGKIHTIITSRLRDMQRQVVVLLDSEPRHGRLCCHSGLMHPPWHLEGCLQHS